VNQVPQGDEDLLRQRLPHDARGAVMSPEAARSTAHWFARAIGPGFKTFLASGLVTSEFYRELTYLYDVRTEYGGRWLDALVRYSLWQPLAESEPPETGADSPETPT